jgi:hypothetical protein
MPTEPRHTGGSWASPNQPTTPTSIPQRRGDVSPTGQLGAYRVGRKLLKVALDYVEALIRPNLVTTR